MKEFMEHLQAYLSQHRPDLGDYESVLSLLYEAYNEANPMDDPQIKVDFNQLYEKMNGMTLKDMDRIIYDSLSTEEKNRLWKLVLQKATVYRTPDGKLSVHIYPKLPK